MYVSSVGFHAPTHRHSQEVQDSRQQRKLQVSSVVYPRGKSKVQSAVALYRSPRLVKRPQFTMLEGEHESAGDPDLSDASLGKNSAWSTTWGSANLIVYQVQLVGQVLLGSKKRSGRIPSWQSLEETGLLRRPLAWRGMRKAKF
jgi:hypothetical protein